MPLFSIIGLMLSVFGATYTAISAFRTHYNPIISEYIKQAPEKVTKIREIRGNFDGDAAQRYAKSMLTAHKWWHWFNIIPIFIFCVFAFGMASWLFFHWDRITGTFDSDFCKYVVESSASLNFVSMLGAGIAYLCLRSKNWHLNEQYVLAGKSAAQPANGNPH